MLLPSLPAPVSTKTALTLFRLGLGAGLLAQAIVWLDRSFVDQMSDQLAFWSQHHPYSWIQWTIITIGVPNRASIASWWAVGQTLAGGALIMGLMTRWMGLAMVISSIALFFLNGHSHTLFPMIEFAIGLCGLIMVVSDAGQYLGLDSLLFSEAPVPVKGRRKKGASAKKAPAYKSRHQQQVVSSLKQRTSRKPAVVNSRVNSHSLHDDDDDDDDDF